MREIDFIPEWYKTDRMRKRQNVRHSTLIAILFSVMMLWSFIAGSHVRHVTAAVEEIQEAYQKSTARVDQTQVLNDEIAALKQKATLLDRITPRTKATSILGELSYLIQKNIILSELSLSYEPIENSGPSQSAASAAVVKVARKQNGANQVVSDVPSRLKVVLTGIASQPAAAASLIARLEETQYFQQVTLVYSKPKQVRQQNVTEFEISCIVADYRTYKQQGDAQ